MLLRLHQWQRKIQHKKLLLLNQILQNVRMTVNVSCTELYVFCGIKDFHTRYALLMILFLKISIPNPEIFAIRILI